MFVVGDQDRRHAAIRKFVSLALGTEGYSVLEADDGLDALHVAARHAGAIDLLVTDVCMPGLDGPELCRRLRREHPETRFLLMSGHAFPPVEPGLAFLPKPFSDEYLLANARQLLDGPPPR